MPGFAVLPVPPERGTEAEVRVVFVEAAVVKPLEAVLGRHWE